MQKFIHFFRLRSYFTTVKWENNLLFGNFGGFQTNIDQCVFYSVLCSQWVKKVIAGLVFIQSFDSLLYDPFFQRNTQSRMQRRYIHYSALLLKMHTKVVKKQNCSFVFSLSRNFVEVEIGSNWKSYRSKSTFQLYNNNF